MHNFKKIAVRVLAVLLTACLFEGFVRFCFEDWNEFTRVSKMERKELEGTLDTLYIGTSLTYRSIDPRIMDETLGTNSFNLATSAQPMMGSYFLLREEAEANPVRTVYLGLCMPSVKQAQKDIRYVSAYENLRTWKWKLRYLLSVQKESVFTTSVLYSTRVSTYTQYSKIKENIRSKLSDASSGRYGMRGFRPTSAVYTGPMKKNRNRKINSWNAKRGIAQTQEESMRYLEKIAKFCQEEGIQLILFVPPTTQDYLDAAKDVEAWDDFCQDFAAKWGAQCYDFMLYKERQRDFPNEMFQDEKHLNGAGAEAFSRLLAEVCASEDPQAYFW